MSACLPMGFSLTAFCLPKGRQLHAKRPPFAARKTAFCKAIDYQRVTRQYHHTARTPCFQQRKGMKIMRNTQLEKRHSAVYPPRKFNINQHSTKPICPVIRYICIPESLAGNHNYPFSTLNSQLTMKTELEKCLAGEPFFGGDPEIAAIA